MTAAAKEKHSAAQRAAIETQAENEVDKCEAAPENKEHSRLQHVLQAARTRAFPASPASEEAAAQRLAEKRQRALLLLRERAAIEAEAEQVVEESESATENKERLEVEKERYNIYGFYIFWSGYTHTHTHKIYTHTHTHTHVCVCGSCCWRAACRQRASSPPA